MNLNHTRTQSVGATYSICLWMPVERLWCDIAHIFCYLRKWRRMANVWCIKRLPTTAKRRTLAPTQVSVPRKDTQIGFYDYKSWYQQLNQGTGRHTRFLITTLYNEFRFFISLEIRKDILFFFFQEVIFQTYRNSNILLKRVEGITLFNCFHLSCSAHFGPKWCSLWAPIFLEYFHFPTQ